MTPNNLRSIALAGLLSLLTSTTLYAKPKTIEDELKELAELAMKCGKKTSFEDYGSWDGITGRYHIDNYSLDVPVNPDGNKPLGLPFPETVTFHFRDGSVQRAPNQIIDQDDSFEIIGTVVGYFGCHYKRKGDFRGHGCGVDRFINDLLEARIRKDIEFIKKNVSPHCYAQDNFLCV